MKKYAKPSMEIVDLHIEDTITSNAISNLYRRGIYVGASTAQNSAAGNDVKGTGDTQSFNTMSM